MINQKDVKKLLTEFVKKSLKKPDGVVLDITLDDMLKALQTYQPDTEYAFKEGYIGFEDHANKESVLIAKWDKNNPLEKQEANELTCLAKHVGCQI